LLTQAKDREKDQTYFLWDINQKVLERVIFPIGNLLKKEVRKQAKERHIKVWDKKGSRGICMVGKMELEEFLKEQGVKEKKGKVIHRNEVIGEHKGVEFYTIGQRHGFTTNKPGPWFVKSKDKGKNILIVGRREELYGDEFQILNFKLILNSKLKNLLVRIRHRGRLIEVKDFSGKKVKLKESVFAVAPGQSAVFYRKDGLVLGGGVIE
jgi:tRNA-specific 2-thiouridylase